MRLLQFIIHGLCAISFIALSGCDEQYLRRLYAERYRQTVTANEGPAANEPASPQPSPTPSLLSGVSIPNCGALKVSSPRGLACLHCTQPEAQSQAKTIGVLLLQSCLKNVAINYLVDGTFSFDAQFLRKHLELLSYGERRVFVYFYLTNGATQRRWKMTSIDSFGTQMSPREFRDRITLDPITQEAYRRIIARLVPVMRYAQSLGAVVSVIPALEDNLTDRAFQEMSELTLDALPVDLAVSIGRNPCPGCYPGAGTRVPSGVFEEFHVAHPYLPNTDIPAVVTNDGRWSYIPGLVSDSEKWKYRVSLDELRAVRDSAAALGHTFILWNTTWQGLPLTGDFYPHPSERDYQMPSFGERQAVVRFLRGE